MPILVADLPKSNRHHHSFESEAGAVQCVQVHQRIAGDLTYCLEYYHNCKACWRTHIIFQYCHCRKHDLLILEDDPYYYLQFPEDHRDPLLGLQGLPRQLSYLHLDVDARVFRIDTFAKFLAPGLRLGWVTAGPAVLEPLAKALQMQTLGPCGLTQVVTHALLEQWGQQGLDDHLRQVQKIYLTRLEAMLTAANSHLTGLATWETPTGGMFLVSDEEAGKKFYNDWVARLRLW